MKIKLGILTWPSRIRRKLFSCDFEMTEESCRIRFPTDVEIKENEVLEIGLIYESNQEH